MGWMHTAKEMSTAEAEERSVANRPDRFWMKKHASADIVLVDEVTDAACVFEHQYKQDGSWKNWLTCTNESDAFCCDVLDRRRSAVYYMTIVDMEGWTDRRGNEHKFELKLFPAKSGTYERFATKSRERGSLAHHVLKARRYGDPKSPGVGDEHEIVRAVDNPEGLWRVANYQGKTLPTLWEEAAADPKKMEALKNTFQLEFDSDGKLVKKVVPFNYEVILAPPSDEMARRLLGKLDPMDADDNSGASKKAPRPNAGGGSAQVEEDDIPF